MATLKSHWITLLTDNLGKKVDIFVQGYQFSGRVAQVGEEVFFLGGADGTYHIPIEHIKFVLVHDK